MTYCELLKNELENGTEFIHYNNDVNDYLQTGVKTPVVSKVIKAIIDVSNTKKNAIFFSDLIEFRDNKNHYEYVETIQDKIDDEFFALNQMVGNVYDDKYDGNFERYENYCNGFFQYHVTLLNEKYKNSTHNFKYAILKQYVEPYLYSMTIVLIKE